MKYGLALTDRLLDRFGDDPGLGYDIMCAFIKTLHNSSIGTKVKKSRLVGVVPAFHGHAHNRKCQVNWHPMYIEGVGTEDFEECERTFCGSNNLAPVTRLATPFHRRQEIQEYFNFHDQDKQANIGMLVSGCISLFPSDHCQADGSIPITKTPLIGLQTKALSFKKSYNISSSLPSSSKLFMRTKKHFWRT
jgi:hypothetical protein